MGKVALKNAGKIFCARIIFEVGALEKGERLIFKRIVIFMALFFLWWSLGDNPEKQHQGFIAVAVFFRRRTNKFFRPTLNPTFVVFFYYVFAHHI